MILVAPIGCAWTDGNVRTSLVFGLGIVRTPAPSAGDTASSVRVAGVEAAGVLAVDAPPMRGFVAGWARSSRIDVPLDSHALIEGETGESGSLRVVVRPVFVESKGDMR